MFDLENLFVNFGQRFSRLLSLQYTKVPRHLDVTAMPVFALNLFNIRDVSEYKAYARRSAIEVQAHGGRVISLAKFREFIQGDISPRMAMILVEWESKDAFDHYRNDPALADLHPHRVNGTDQYIWHLFDKLDDLRPLLNHEQP